MRTIEEKARMWDAVCAENKIPCDVCKYEKFYDDMNKYLVELEASIKWYGEQGYSTPIHLQKTHDKILEIHNSVSSQPSRDTTT